MVPSKRFIGGQLRIGDAELGSHDKDEIIAKIDAACDLAGMTHLLFLPSHSKNVNEAVTTHCQKRGIGLYLWYKVLADNDIQAEASELLLDAWGRREAGETGVWTPIFNLEEGYRFSCPHNMKYNTLLLNRCSKALEEYDGLFADCIGYPLPSLGIESLFTCFCPSCIETEPRLEAWRRKVREMREYMFSASDDDLEKWGTFNGVIAAFGLLDFYRFRIESVTILANSYGALAKEKGKKFGLDVLSPALADMGGHSYADLAKSCDWLKPRIYCRTYGPSSIPLEFNSMARGIQAWAKRCSNQAVMAFIERSIGIKMPSHLHKLSESYLPPEVVVGEIAKVNSVPNARVYPGIECSLHPDFDTGLTAETVKGYLEATRGNSGMVLSWNLLFIPDAFLELVGKL